MVICHFDQEVGEHGTDTFFIKRVVGLPGETVSIQDGFVYVNGSKLEEDYLTELRRDNEDMEQITLGEGQYFVLGDNRINSTDSRLVGPIAEDKIIGKHKGIIRYTIGQRKGLGLALDRSMYVIGKDLVRNEVYIGDTEHLMKKELFASSVNLLALDSIDTPIRVKAKIRYKQEEKDAWAVMENGLLHVTFDEPQRAICKGQSVVLYDGDIVIGGGIIE